ncbi:uncharacterized protein LOC109793896 [Cajanus cajan]|uniref:uncharacterized protein LOC109793896 n=1 Tax=Cajanus cajan TaxID=3821 RepID=UPI00098D909D|nr:uncharacterized protein LOC109793896 [Cajanus cajan]
MASMLLGSFSLASSLTAGIMGKNLWRELKHRYNVTELEVPEPQEEDVPPLKVIRKRKRGAKEVGGTSDPADAEEVTSTAADASAVDLTESPPPKEAPQVAFEEVVRAAKVAIPATEQVTQASEVEGDTTEAATEVAGRVVPAAEVAVPATEQVAPTAEARSEVPSSPAAASAPPSGSSQGVSRS